MWFHGGGWVLGNVVDYDPICTFIAAEVGCVVVSVDYRMAPEHRAPVAVEDCVDATTWVGVNGDVLRADTSRMAVAGDSAGGNLAAVVAQVLRDHGDTRLRAPGPDLPGHRPDHGVALDRASTPNAAILTKRSMDAFRDHYVPAGHDLRDPLLSPLFGRLDGLPPALVQTADLDPIRDDGIRYAARAARCRGADPAHELPQGAPRLRLHAGCGPGRGAPAAVGAGQRAHRRAGAGPTADRLRTCARSSCSPGRPTPPSPTGSATSWG